MKADELPVEFVAAIEFNMGPAQAHQWLLAAVASANTHATMWGVTFDKVLTGGALSLCVAGTSATGDRVVMKVPSDIFMGQSEVAALKSWQGAGCPQVLAVDEDTSVFLMEYLHQSGSVIEAEDVYQLAAALHRGNASRDFRFPYLRENVGMRIQWAEERFAVDEYAHLRDDLDSAKILAERLLDTSTEEVLLHGDFQRKNLIPTSGGLMTLDPHACVGERVFDAAFWMGLVHHDDALEKVLSRYPAKSDSEFRRFSCWAWVISVIENRPYQERGAIARQDFISAFRMSAIDAGESL